MNALDYGDMAFEDVGLGPIDMRRHGLWMKAVRLSAVALVHKSDGAANNGPSLCFICRESSGDVATTAYYHELSVATLATALAQAGYVLRREEPCSR